MAKISKNKLGWKIISKFDDYTKYIFFVYLIFLILFFKTIFDIENYYIKSNLPKTDYREYLLILVGLIISRGLFYVTKITLSGFILRNMAPSKYVETKQEQVYRIILLIYSFIYYTGMSIINYYVIKNYQLDCLPRFLGGTLSVIDYLQKYPSQVHLYVRTVFLVSIGHHVERTLEQLFQAKRIQGFWTMLLHHVLTINLMIQCFAHRQYFFGIPILFIHDLTDINLKLVKIVREIKPWKPSTIPVYLCLCGVWFITRNYIFNLEIVIPLWTSVIFDFVANKMYSHIFASCGVGILMILNTYWMYCLVYSGYQKLVNNIDGNFNEGENHAKIVDIDLKKKDE